VNRYPAVAHRVAQGEDMPVWFIMGVALVVPLLIVVGIAVLERHLHASRDPSLTFGDACMRASFACTPLALYMLAGALGPDYLMTSPFGFFAWLLEALIEGSNLLGQLLISGISFVWLAFFLIYAKLSHFTSRTLVAFIAAVPIYVTILMGLEIAIISRWID